MLDWAHLIFGPIVIWIDQLSSQSITHTPQLTFSSQVSVLAAAASGQS